ncbi:MAG: nitrate ABC transporter, permease protein, partial [Thalassospira sp.]|nr:nitrate ABC transporter, permease protein [Thalassospira sp.]
MLASLNARALVLSLVLLAVFLGLWEAASPKQQLAGELTEYELLMGGAEP